MDPFSPATPPATKQDQPSSTKLAEREVVASLLLLKEAAGPEEDKENNHLVPDESTVEVRTPVPIYPTFLFFPLVQETSDPSIFLVDLSTWSLTCMGVEYGQVNMDVEKEGLDKTVVGTSSLAEEFRYMC
jgi:hypothetical protein